MDKKFYHKNVVITGGSSGIGLAIAKEFAKLEACLFLLARDQQRLDQAKVDIQHRYPNTFIEVFSTDVSQEEHVQQTMQNIATNYGGIHTIIANAGMVHVEKFATIPVTTMRKLMETNYWGTVYAIKYAWPYISQTQGHIGLVSSVAGYVGLIGYPAYSPTKFAMSGLAQCLRKEAKQAGIGLTIVYPADTDTPQLVEENKNILPELAILKKHASILSPELVANIFVQAIQKNKFEVFCNWQSKWIRRILAFWPSLAE